MPKITIYTTNACGFCAMAKNLLRKKGAKFEEIDVNEAAARERMVERTAGKRSVPQIFIDDQHVGGCDDLYALDAKGGLDALLVSA